MSKKIYVGNLPYTATDADLKNLFAEYGAIDSVFLPIDKMSGRPRGFGFVEMSSDTEAQAAIEGLNGKEYEGRKLMVNEARPLADRPPRRSFGGGSRGGFGGGGYGGGGREY